ncbi:hypothetical protein ZWY2020_020415 [Hordeum vulgare]|nr:hypothetical protein ZWY2020_020415 [Hordeum vulgare]
MGIDLTFAPAATCCGRSLLLWPSPTTSNPSMTFPVDPETDAAAGYDYPPDDQSFIAEQKDDGTREMAYPVDKDCYPDGAYYYVEAADDHE